MARLSPAPLVSTCHGRLDLPEVNRVYRDFPEQPLVAISDNQRAYLPTANWAGTVYNAVDVTGFHFRPAPGDYLVFLGRICPEKRPDRAIEIARDVGMRLVIAAKIDTIDVDYWEHAIEPLIRANPSLIEFVGEVDERGKDELLGGARAYLFPIDWPEPFGLTMTEAMATGTPVIAYRAGSVPEVVEHGVTGFVCDSLSAMVAAVEQVGALDRSACRRRVEQLFSSAAMADGYERAYQFVVDGWRGRVGATSRFPTLPIDHRMNLSSFGSAYLAARSDDGARVASGADSVAVTRIVAEAVAESQKRDIGGPTAPFWGDPCDVGAGTHV
jgi:glycosyltransferase involved in cell wall biosynthesis